MIIKIKKYRWLAICFIPLLVSCSFSFTYNRLAWFIDWYVDDYVDLTWQQDDLFDAQFELWHQWHRETQLVLYHQQLTQFKMLLTKAFVPLAEPSLSTLTDTSLTSTNVTSSKLTPAQLNDQLNQVEQHWLRLLDHIAPELAQLMLKLTPEQKHTLIENLQEETQEKRDEYLDKSLAERMEDKLERAEKQFKKWVGPLTKAQKAKIENQLSLYQATDELWFEYQLTWQAELKYVLLAADSALAPQAQLAKLINLLAQPRQLRSTELEQAIKHNRQLYSQSLAHFLNNLNSDQQKHLIDKIDDYLVDFKQLQSD